MAAKRNRNNIPEELMEEILVRLPVKSLLRFKAVSHPWSSLISSPTFINSHLRRNITQSDDKCILTQVNNSVSAIHLFSDQNDDIDLEFPFSGGEFPLRFPLTVIGSYNGIVCATLSYCPDGDGPFGDMYLWNPATKQSKLIPPHNLMPNFITWERYGFGFDSIANDFKIVRVLSIEGPYDHDVREYAAQVYSANNNVWTLVDPPLDYPYDFSFHVCVKGVLCCHGFEGSLVTFDLNKEVFNCSIRLPIVKHDIPCVTEFRGSVALIDYSESEITLWKLDDACLLGGTEGSWTQIFKFDVGFKVDFCKSLYLNSGDILLTTGGSFRDRCLYNLDKKESRPVRIPSYKGYNIFKYSESLVSVTGFKQVRLNAHGDDN